ncbi:MAG TPA: transketolase [Candidatus Methylacidiphilales bacterium]|nr:transketolase [Candidatus Methylacidiphilales bacterium]
MPTTPDTETKPSSLIEQQAINTIRTLCIDAVQQANSGHPGTPMAMAPVVYTLWQEFLRFDPEDPIWPNRDRFVLSAGHASALLYAMLHLTGVVSVNAKYERLGELSVKLDDLKRFRQLDSKCPGHPEYRWTSGVETTTGPLGQGVATSVGMAIASRWLAARYNRPNQALFDFRVYALAGDGCMMEGVSSEAASLAGHLKLSNLCWIYDNNHITIEGSTQLAFTEDVAGRFQAYGWNVLRVSDANDLEKLRHVFGIFQRTQDKPTLIIVDSHIGYGSPHKQDTAGVHGEPLGEEEVRATKRAYGWPEDAKFLVPPEVVKHFNQGIGERASRLRQAWMDTFGKYKESEPALAAELTAMQQRECPEGWDRELPVFPPDAKGMGGRDASGKVLNAIAKHYPWLLGGAADLAPSTKTRLTFDHAGDFEPGSYGGRNFHFGVREHAMGAILNGLALSKLRPFGSGFLIFSDYGRNPIRLAAIMELSVIYIFTHDSIGVGEDGPTHQPIEQLPSLRSIPGLVDLRPGDANETAEAWRVILSLPREPVVLILSRQPLPTLDRAKYAPAAGVRRGGYILSEATGGKPDVLLIATGSEISLAVAAQDELNQKNVKARVISLPSWELFSRQPASYRDEVFPPDITARVSIEQASTFGWQRFVGLKGASIGMDSFGASAPLKELQKKFGFTVENVVNVALKQVGRA